MAKRQPSGDQGVGGPPVFAIVQQIPPRVTAAFSAMSHLHSFRVMSTKFDGGVTELRDFSKNEAALWNTSLEALRLYISGESNASDVKPLKEDRPPGIVVQSQDGQVFYVPDQGMSPPSIG